MERNTPLPIKKIAIIGNAGSGKSTLAQQLHKILSLPIYHLDQYFRKPGWVRRDHTEYHPIHNALCDGDGWIIEGMNLKYLDYRIQKADIVIFLDVSRYICLGRIFKRFWKYYGKEAPSSAVGCKEELSWEFIGFLKFVWNFNSKNRPKVIALLEQYKNSKQIKIAKSQKDIKELLKILSCKEG